LAENEYMKEYGFKNKTEIWKTSSILGRFKKVAKDYISSTTKQSAKQSKELLAKLISLGLLSDTSLLNDILTLTEKDLMERRLQTAVCRLGLARTMRQARQLITHGHIKVNGIKITSPGYLVKKLEEANITFSENSSIGVIDHPERVKISAKKDEPKVEKKEVKSDGRRNDKQRRRPMGKRRTDDRGGRAQNKK